MGLSEHVFRIHIASLSGAIFYVDASSILHRLVLSYLRAGSSSALEVSISDIALSRDVSFPCPLLQFHHSTLLRLSSPSPPLHLLLASREQHYPLPPRAQSIKGKLRAELEDALEMERQMLMAQGEHEEDEGDEKSTSFPAKMLVAEDVPWQTFLESKFGLKAWSSSPTASQSSSSSAAASALSILSSIGTLNAVDRDGRDIASAGMEMKELARACATHIQRMFRGYLVGNTYSVFCCA